MCCRVLDDDASSAVRVHADDGIAGAGLGEREVALGIGYLEVFVPAVEGQDLAAELRELLVEAPHTAGDVEDAPTVELTHDAPTGAVWQNLDLIRFATATGLDVLPIVLEQTAPIDATDKLVRNWPAPDFGIDRHRIYMAQWYLFAATAAGLWLYFNLRRTRKDGTR